MTIRVLIADDQPVVRDGLAMLLGLIDDVEVVATAADGVEAVERARTERPDIVLMDLRMPRGIPSSSRRAMVLCGTNALTGDEFAAAARSKLPRPHTQGGMDDEWQQPMPMIQTGLLIPLDGYVAGPEQSLEHPIGVGGMRLHDGIRGVETWRRGSCDEVAGEATADSELLKPEIRALVHGGGEDG